MAFLDNIFGASNYSDTLSRLLGYPQYQKMGEFEGFPDSYQNYGGIMQPVFGKPEEQAALPPQAAPTQAQAPQAAQPMAAPQPQSPDFAQRIGAFSANKPYGLIARIAGAATGQRMDDPRGTDDIREFEYARRSGFTGSFADWMHQKRTGVEQHGLSPIYGKDAQGNTVLLQLGNKGTVIQPKLPGDVKISEGIEKLDLGDRWGLYERRSGQIIGFQPKNLQAAEEQKAVGKERGGAMADLESIASKMPGLESTVGHLAELSNQATYTKAGQIYDSARRQLNAEPREGAVARVAYDAIIKNQIIPMLRDTFGPQFTQREGEQLRETLGQADLAPKEKHAILTAFIEQKKRDVDALRRRFEPQTAPQTAPQAAQQPSGVDPILEAKQAIARGAPRERVMERLKSMGINPSGL